MRKLQYLVFIGLCIATASNADSPSEVYNKVMEGANLSNSRPVEAQSCPTPTPTYPNHYRAFSRPVGSENLQVLGDDGSVYTIRRRGDGFEIQEE